MFTYTSLFFHNHSIFLYSSAIYYTYIIINILLLFSCSIPKIRVLNILNWESYNGFVNKSSIILPVRQYLIFISSCFTLSVKKKYWIDMSRVFFVLKNIPFFSHRMLLFLLSCNTVVYFVLWCCHDKKYLVRNTWLMLLLTQIISTSVELFRINFYLDNI